MSVLEKEFQKQLTDLAEIFGWQWAHFRPANTGRGWKTPVSGTIGKGWPDLTLIRVKDKRILFVECKRVGAKVSEFQAIVLENLRRAGQEVYIWNELDWDEIQEVLQ